MTQFDQTTEKKAGEFALGPEGSHDKSWTNEMLSKGFTEGRNSAKESLEILARALDFHTGTCVTAEGQRTSAAHAIAQVKARGDWPLEET